MHHPSVVCVHGITPSLAPSTRCIGAGPAQVARLDNIVYGRAGTMAGGGAAQRRAAHTAGNGTGAGPSPSPNGHHHRRPKSTGRRKSGSKRSGGSRARSSTNRTVRGKASIDTIVRVLREGRVDIALGVAGTGSKSVVFRS
jgi:hypothetical protein